MFTTSRTDIHPGAAAPIKVTFFVPADADVEDIDLPNRWARAQG